MLLNRPKNWYSHSYFGRNSRLGFENCDAYINTQIALHQPFFNHLAATNVTRFSETLSLARKSLSLVKNSLSLTEKFLSLEKSD